MKAEAPGSMTSTMTLALKPASNEQVRSKFLNMIGIESKLPPATMATSTLNFQEGSAPHTAQLVTSGTNWVNPRSQNVTVHKEFLKYDRVAAERFSPKRRKTESPIKLRKRTGFNESVTVVPIPMRHEYSNRVRSRLWSNALEIHENAARNTIEFASEGYVPHILSAFCMHGGLWFSYLCVFSWDWRTVTEDESMYVCVATGELIHPCHYDASFSRSPPSSPAS